MLKRGMTILLAISMMMGISSGLSEGSDTGALRVVALGGEVTFAADAYTKQYPERVLEEITLEYSENDTRQTQQYLLAHPNEWDVAYVWTSQCDLTLLCESGLLMDLSREERLLGYYANLYPNVREAASWGEGIYGVPDYIASASSLFTIASEVRLQSLGLSMADVPGTFTELCELAEKYMALPKTQRKGTVFHVDGNQGSYLRYFLYQFLTIYTAEYCDLKGAIEYDTEAFRQGMKSLLAMAEALETDKKIQRGPGVSIYGLMADSSNALIGHDNPYYSLIYPNIGQEKVVPARMGMLVVNAKTKRLQEALDLIECSRQLYALQFSPCLGAVDYQALCDLYYDEAIANQIEKAAYAETEPVLIDALEKGRAAGEPGYSRAFYTQEAIADYAENIAPHLTFPLMPEMDAYAIAKQFTRVTLDVDGLIQKLQSIADEQAAPRE